MHSNANRRPRRARNGDQQDVFSRHRRGYAGAAAVKRQARRQERQEGKRELRAA